MYMNEGLVICLCMCRFRGGVDVSEQRVDCVPVGELPEQSRIKGVAIAPTKGVNGAHSCAWRVDGYVDVDFAPQADPCVRHERFLGLGTLRFAVRDPRQSRRVVAGPCDGNGPRGKVACQLHLERE